MEDAEDIELRDGRRIRFTDRALQNFDDDDHDGCPFCLGRAAAHRGESDTTNPYPAVDFSDGSVDYYDTDYGLWQVGHDVGSGEPGGLLWFEQPNHST